MLSVHHYDLEKQQFKIKKISSAVRRAFIGGRALAAWWAFEHIPSRIPSLSKHNQIILAPGSLTGSKIIGANRTTCVFQSPISGTISCSSAGGNLGKYLKGWSINLLVIAGELQDDSQDVAQNFLVLEDGKVKIESFPQLHPFDINEARTFLQQEIFTQEHLVVLTGRAAQNGMYFANVSSEPNHFFGRGGLGAVLYSKRLRGLIIAPPSDAADEDAMMTTHEDQAGNERINQFNNMILSSSLHQEVSKKGTKALLQPLLMKGMLTKKQLTEDWIPSIMTGEEKLFLRSLGVDLRKIQIKSDSRVETHLDEKKPLELSLTVLDDELENDLDKNNHSNSRATMTKNSGNDDEDVRQEPNENLTPKTENDPLVSAIDPSFSNKLIPWLCLGPNLNQFDIEIVVRSIKQCNDAGVDVVSVAGSLGNLAFLADHGQFPGMDSFEWDKKRLNKLLTEAIIENKPPLSEWLSIGETYLLEQKGFENGTCIKRMFIGPFNPRQSPLFYLGTILSPRGGCHLRGGMGWLNEILDLYPVRVASHRKRMVQTVVTQTIYLTILDTLGLDYFIYFSWLDAQKNRRVPQNFFKRLSNLVKTRWSQNHGKALLQWLADLLSIQERLPSSNKYTSKDLWYAGLRGYLTERLFNLRNGIRDVEEGMGRHETNPQQHVITEKDYQELLLNCHQMFFLEEPETPQKGILEKLQLDKFLTQF